jgi:hypothetical protein
MELPVARDVALVADVELPVARDVALVADVVTGTWRWRLTCTRADVVATCRLLWWLSL